MTDLFRPKKKYIQIRFIGAGGGLLLLEKPMFLKEKDLVVFQ
jgi:hypothetical protein